MQHEEKLHSEAALMADIIKLSDAGASLIQVRSREPIRAAMLLRKNLADGSETTYQEWDCINGFRLFGRDDFTNNVKVGDKLMFQQAFELPMEKLRDKNSPIHADDDKVHYFVFIDPHPFMANNPFATELAQQYAAILPSTNVCILLLTPEITLSDLPSGTVLVADMPTPTVEELIDSINDMLDKSTEDFPERHDLNEDDVAEIAQLGLGLTLFECETYTALAIVEAGQRRERCFSKEMLSAGIAKGKTEVVKQSEILELYPTVDMSEVGGMNRLKDWVAVRSNCYSDEAREFGIEPPKGVVTVGVPGTGKSLVAKAIASSLGVPLVRMDFARVFSKYVGDSESRVRAALKMAEAMAPCVLFVDEIDKGMGGASGGGDSGTSSRVLGTYLTWLNDTKAPIFNMVTANKIDGLPPELLRKGRFDQIFSVGLPNRKERLEVLHIHLRKRGHELDFTKPEVSQFLEHSDTYVPAEIEAAVRDALILAFNKGEDLSMAHIVASLKDMVPMSRSNAVQINAMLEWARTNAIAVNYAEDEKPETVADNREVAPAAASTRRLRNRGAK